MKTIPFRTEGITKTPHRTEIAYPVLAPLCRTAIGGHQAQTAPPKESDALQCCQAALQLGCCCCPQTGQEARCLPATILPVAAMCSPYWCPSTALLRRTTRVFTGAMMKGAPHMPTGCTL